ncbi:MULTISPECIES: DUF3046 domain-containing protein [Trueperella]|uniref:DUF3046 domain-containing protein n=1 Tax=Trueperella bernardiae TaxID=59561 RepID=A0A0W1KL75_9ACTO|nr:MULTISPECIES: DUF3046 domain-containing protein [Trueperella]KTF04792.1 hypothetical protein AQZ59_00092 [Trueperella bernardiae]MCM3907293.1 DUF3046 domain-containing protein [Trueperella bernardiae]MDV6238151.1 DUF3046 domain-containing protein [Trueperella bernardiae]OCW61105.1 hypothetical protein AKG36_01395 [Trueperella bernardiae]OFS65792.1 hypothetical protein HMPREF3174_07010 [Trueperella sp. HMSC08H06]
MRHSEFWEVVERAFPNGRGLALAHDLVIPELGSRPAAEAIADTDPQEVWHALRVAMDLPESYEYLHRKSK